jgi:D-glycero-D-manno-heptose 1,7-bisphosphate phosphatase
MSAPAPLIVLDRDGVINHDADTYIKSVDEWQPLPGSLEAIARLSRSGYRIVVVTNQSGVGRGLFDLATLERIHARLRDAVTAAGGHIDGIYYCPHAPTAHCGCRKPKLGLLRDIEADLGLRSWQGVPLVGDKRSDLEMARAVGARGILVRTGKGEQALRELGDTAALEVYADLAATVDALLREAGRA